MAIGTQEYMNIETERSVNAVHRPVRRCGANMVLIMGNLEVGLRGTVELDIGGLAKW